MVLAFSVRRLLLATWKVPPEQVATTLPAGLDLALADGSALVSIAAFKNEALRLSGWPVPSFSQLNVRTYVTSGGEPAVFFLALRVTPSGLGGALFGAPFRPAVIRIREGAVEARGLGVSIRYRRAGEPAEMPQLETGPLGTHDVGFFVAAGLRRLVARHDPFLWEEAELLEPPLTELLLALGFDVGEPASTVYAERTPFQVDLPPEKVADSRS